MSERPAGVAVLAILIMILGILGIVGGIFIALFLAVPSAFLGLPMSGLYLIPGLIVAAVSVIYLIAGIGLWMVKNWGRILTIILAILLIIGSIFELFAFPIGTISGIIGIVLGILIVWYLASGDVSSYFS